MESLANIFRHLVHPHENHDETRRSHYRHPQEESTYLLLGQGTEKQHTAQASPAGPTRQEVLNYLGQLADDYRVPRRVVYALAEAESHINPEIDPQPNYLKRNEKFVLDKQGNKKVISWDYGLLQINSGTIGKKVKDATGHVFHVEPNVKDKGDWKVNAVAGVAIFADAYHLAQLEQGPGATGEDHAQQAHSQYNGGSPKSRERYLKEKNGVPENGADRNFLRAYGEWKHVKK
jgi:hypothetical protein